MVDDDDPVWFISSSIPLSPVLVKEDERELWAYDGELQRFFERNKLLWKVKIISHVVQYYSSYVFVNFYVSLLITIKFKIRIYYIIMLR